MQVLLKREILDLRIKIEKRKSPLQEPIYITQNGEGDLVFMSIDAFEKREQVLQLRAKVLQAEQERMEGAETLSVSQAREQLRERINGI